MNALPNPRVSFVAYEDNLRARNDISRCRFVQRFAFSRPPKSNLMRPSHSRRQIPRIGSGSRGEQSAALRWYNACSDSS